MRIEDASYEQRIQRTSGQLRACGGDYRPIHEDLERKRQAWWEANRDALRLSGPLPRQAYTMFLLQHLGLDPAEAPVVYEDERRIVWRSFNFCSMLEACVRLGIDTRQVCREGTEESVGHPPPGLTRACASRATTPTASGPTPPMARRRSS